jgi:hypothetical protein
LCRWRVAWRSSCPWRRRSSRSRRRRCPRSRPPFPRPSPALPPPFPRRCCSDCLCASHRSCGRSLSPRWPIRHAAQDGGGDGRHHAQAARACRLLLSAAHGAPLPLNRRRHSMLNPVSNTLYDRLHPCMLLSRARHNGAGCFLSLRVRTHLPPSSTDRAAMAMARHVHARSMQRWQHESEEHAAAAAAAMAVTASDQARAF